MKNKNSELRGFSKVGDFLLDTLEIKDRSLRWLSKNIEISYETLRSQIKGNNLRIEPMIKASIILGVDLNRLKDFYPEYYKRE